MDRNERKIIVDFNSNKIDINAHADWKKNIKNNKLEPQPYWGFDDLFHKAGTKLHNCFFVWAESKKINGELHFHYQYNFMLKKFDINRFVDAIENGSVYIDFDARTGHNHGTKFRLRRESLIDLYAEVQQY